MRFVGLVTTELRRFRLRRAMRWLIGLGMLVAVIVNAVQLARSERTTDFERAVMFGEFPSECVTDARDGLPVVDLGCVERSGVEYGIGFGDVEPPEGDQAVLVRTTHDRRVRVGVTFEETIRGIGIGLALLGVLFGSTFLAAEFGASGLSTQLVFEPRRVRLYVAKAIAVLLGAAASAALLIVWTGLLQFGVSSIRGSTAGVDAAWLGERAADVLRASAACGFGAVCAMAVGAIARRTVVAVGIFFGLVVATGFLAAVPWGEPLARVSPMNTLFAVGFGDLHDPDAFIGLRTLSGAVGISLVWVVALSTIGAWWFDRREIR